MAKFKFILIVLACVVVSDEGAKILAVFPTPSISHQVVFRPLIMKLVERGHEVVIITTDPVFKEGGAPANLTELDVHDISNSNSNSNVYFRLIVHTQKYKTEKSIKNRITFYIHTHTHTHTKQRLRSFMLYMQPNPLPHVWTVHTPSYNAQDVVGTPTDTTSYDVWRKGMFEPSTASGNKKDLKNQMKKMMALLLRIFESQMQVDEVRNMLNKSQNFDLLLWEAYFAPLLALSHVYKVPVIQISSFGSSEENVKVVGAPSHPILYPNPLVQRVNNLTLWEKISQIYNFYQLNKMFLEYEETCHVALQRTFGADIPKISELNNNVDMLFLNVHSVWDRNRPVPPNVIYMGGIHLKPEKELPQDLKTYLDSSENGVIYISFGTNVDPALLPPEKLQAIVNAVSKLPYDVLWKWNHDELPGRTPNIKISKWLPQSDLLRHPKVKLFITQGGLQSTDEAITAGVPLIGMPMLGDQWFNVELYVYHQIGLKIDMDTITEDEVTNAIMTIINDKSYRENVERLRQLMHDQPQTPLERAVWWMEYVIRHSGARHLRSPAANMPWHQYLELELVTYVVLGVLSVIFSIVFVVFYLHRNWQYNVKIKRE